MLVADLSPIVSADIHSEDLIARGLGNPGGTHMPPRSFVSSAFSDSETIPKEESRSRSRDMPSPRSVRSGLDSRRQERRNRRNVSIREKELEKRLEKRLEKIERDNRMLLSTLSGISRSFGELGRILPWKRDDEGSTVGREVKMEEQGPLGEEEEVEGRVKTTRSLEPLMRELQGVGARVSAETERDDDVDGDRGDFY